MATGIKVIVNSSNPLLDSSGKINSLPNLSKNDKSSQLNERLELLTEAADKVYRRLSTKGEEKRKNMYRDKSKSLSGPTFFAPRRKRRNLSLDEQAASHRRKSHNNIHFSPLDTWERETIRLRQLRFEKLMTRRRLIRLFRTVAKITVFCIRSAKSHCLRNKLYDEISPYVNGLAFYDYDTPPDIELLFDPGKFKADKQRRIGEEVKKILNKPPSFRTSREIQFAAIALRNIKAVAEYPVRMQKKIAQYGQYEKYDAKRVIVRQGHPATAFYFILSGSVVVMVSDEETKVAQAVAYLEKGQTFGELAIINRTMRQSTVIVKESIELLSIDVNDFHKIFMLGGVKNLNDPDYEDFISHIGFLNGWPIEKLLQYPKLCIFNYFKRGSVMAKDSNFSEWIFIVKSGSINVLKKLKRVEPFEWKKKQDIQTGQNVKTEKQKREEKELRIKQRRYILPELKIPLKIPEDEDQEQQRGKLVLPPLLISPQNKAEKEAMKRGETINETSLVTRLPYLQEFDVPTTPERPRSNPEIGEMGNLDENLRENFRRTQSMSNKQATKDVKEEWEREQHGRTQKIRTFADDLDGGMRFRRKSEPTEADLDPQFVQVQTLTKGQAFGIAETVLGKQPSFCVISNGAECIMMKKSFYLEYAPDDLIRNMRQQCCPYPTDEEMQDGLQTSVDWDSYKALTFRETLDQVYVKKTPRVNSIEMLK